MANSSLCMRHLGNARFSKEVLLKSPRKQTPRLENSANDPGALLYRLPADVTAVSSLGPTNSCDDQHDCDLEPLDRTTCEGNSIVDAKDIFLSRRGHFNNEKAIDEKDEEPSDTLHINVGGQHFEVLRNTLQKQPDLLKRVLNDGMPRKDKLTGNMEYYFDRDADIFRFVLMYCRLGQMHVPTNICGPVLEQELDLWGLQVMSADIISPDI